MTRADVASTAYVSHLNMRIRVFVARLTYGLGDVCSLRHRVLCLRISSGMRIRASRSSANYGVMDWVLDERRHYAIYRMLDLWRLTRLQQKELTCCFGFQGLGCSRAKRQSLTKEPRYLQGYEYKTQNMYLKVKCHQGAQTLPPIEVFQLRKR